VRILACALFLLASTPAAAYPILERGVLDVGSTPVDVVVSDDDRFVGVAGSDGAFYLVDTADFDAPAVSSSACSTAVALDFARYADVPTFYVACNDGTVATVEVDDTTIPATLGAGEAYALGTGSLVGVAVSADAGYLFAAEEADSESIVHVVELETGTVDGLTGFPMTSIYATSCFGMTPLGTYVVMGNDQGRVTKLYDGGGSYYLATYSLLGLGTFSDLAFADEGYVYLLESSGMIIQYYLSGDTSYMTMSLDLGTVVAFDIVDTADETLFYTVDDGGTLSVIPFTGGDPEGQTALSQLPAGDLAAASAEDGYVYVGGEDDSLVVVGEAPWVQITSVDPEEIYEGETVTLTFSVDEDSSYDVFVGGGIDQSGTHLWAYDGSASAGQTLELEIDGDQLEEGDNRLWVFATANGFVGRDSASVYLDTPPDQPREFDVAFGDEKLYVTWTSNDESDISHYIVHFADEEFDEASGAPEFQVIGEGVVHTSPLTISHEGEDVGASATLENLTNGVEYCTAVLAVDAGGMEGPWTATLCESPEQTIGAGDNLGYCGTCASSGGARGGLLGLLGLALALGWRRSIR
jgi:MYXO-CTERM domain-containing protein